MKICKNCNTKNNDISVYCGECGMLLDEKNTLIINDDISQENEIPASGKEYEQKFVYEEQPKTINTGAQNNYYRPQPTESRPVKKVYHSERYYGESPAIKKPTVTKKKVVTGLIIATLFGGILGIIFGLIALVSYGDYESAVARNDVATANSKIDKIRKCNKGAWICGTLGIVFSVIIFCLSFIGAFLGFDSDFPFDDVFDFDSGFVINDSDPIDEYEYPDFDILVNTALINNA